MRQQKPAFSESEKCYALWDWHTAQFEGAKVRMRGYPLRELSKKLDLPDI